MEVPKWGKQRVEWPDDARNVVPPLRGAGDFWKPPPPKGGRGQWSQLLELHAKHHRGHGEDGRRRVDGELKVLERARCMVVRCRHGLARGRLALLFSFQVLYPGRIPALVQEGFAMGEEGMGQRPKAQTPRQQQQARRRRPQAALSLGRWKGARHVRLAVSLPARLRRPRALGCN
jgi:hypothetical protein